MTKSKKRTSKLNTDNLMQKELLLLEKRTLEVEDKKLRSRKLKLDKAISLIDNAEKIAGYPILKELNFKQEKYNKNSWELKFPEFTIRAYENIIWVDMDSLICHNDSIVIYDEDECFDEYNQKDWITKQDVLDFIKDTQNRFHNRTKYILTLPITVFGSLSARNVRNRILNDVTEQMREYLDINIAKITPIEIRKK